MSYKHNNFYELNSFDFIISGFMIQIKIKFRLEMKKKWREKDEKVVCVAIIIEVLMWFCVMYS